MFWVVVVGVVQNFFIGEQGVCGQCLQVVEVEQVIGVGFWYLVVLELFECCVYFEIWVYWVWDDVSVDGVGYEVGNCFFCLWVIVDGVMGVCVDGVEVLCDRGVWFSI